MKPFGAAARDAAKRFFRHENSALAIVLIGIIATMAGVTKGATLRRGNITNIWLHSSTRGIAAVGQTFVILTGGIDVSIGGIGLMASILGASIMDGQSGFPWVAIGAALMLGLGIGVINGTLVSRIGMPALIVTLAMWQITKGGGFLICRGHTFRELPESINFFGAGSVAGVPVPTIIFISVAVLVYIVLHHTAYGRSVYAVGGNPVSAWLSGINVRKILFSVYCIAGFLGALCGFVLMSRVMCGGMNVVVGLELDSITAVVIGGISLMGGRGTLIGAVIGVIILGVINNGMNVLAVDPAYQDVAKGIIIIIAVAVDYIRRR